MRQSASTKTQRMKMNCAGFLNSLVLVMCQNVTNNIAEVRINGYERVEKVLLNLRDHIRFKRQQVKLMLDVLAIVKVKQTPEGFLKACKLADEISALNYASRRKHTAENVEQYLRKEQLLSP